MVTGIQQLGSARQHHYVFAHLALRQIALGDPLECLDILGSSRAGHFIRDVFSSVCDHIEDEPDFSPSQIVVHPTQIGRYPCAVVQMPQPQAATEAFYAATVVLVDIRRAVPPNLEKVTARYFTLEMGHTPETTVLAEWTANAHVNYGNGPSANLDDFRASLERLIR